MNNSEKILVFCGVCITVLITIVGIVSLLTKLANHIEENMCYNMPLNEFYETPECLKYKEVLK